MPTLPVTAHLTRPLTLAAAIGGVLVAATALLWTYYGSAVFFELVRTGWVACFG